MGGFDEHSNYELFIHELYSTVPDIIICFLLNIVEHRTNKNIVDVYFRPIENVMKWVICFIFPHDKTEFMRLKI